ADRSAARTRSHRPPISLSRRTQIVAPQALRDAKRQAQPARPGEMAHLAQGRGTCGARPSRASTRDLRPARGLASGPAGLRQEVHVLVHRLIISALLGAALFPAPV